MAWTYESLVEGIRTYLAANLSDYADYRYVGPYYHVDSSSDFNNANNGLYPALGIVLDVAQFAQDQSMGATNPVIKLSLYTMTRDTGARPADEMPIFYRKVQALQNLVMNVAHQDASHFGLSDIRAVTPIYGSFFPGFLGKQEGNRKGYNIAEFGLELHMTSI